VSSQFRESNPNWRGGRTVASNGYVLLRVGVGHHLANVTGYAYEHRIVAEEKLGRRLLSGEMIHHIDGNKENNDPSNIKVVTATQHRAEHRTRQRGLKEPGEPNVTIECACGCGERFQRFDRHGRPRRFISGHNPIASPLQDRVLHILSSGARKRGEIAKEAQATLCSVRCALTRLKQANLIRSLGGGFWEIRS